jgi:hypothetical protein
LPLEELEPEDDLDHLTVENLNPVFVSVQHTGADNEEIDFSTARVQSGGGLVLPSDNKGEPGNRTTGSGPEGKPDSLLAGDVDDLLRALPEPAERGFEQELFSGLDIVRTLLTGTTARPDLVPQQGTQVAPVATLLLNTGSDAPDPGQSAQRPSFPLSDLLISPARTFPAIPLGENPLSAQPSTSLLGEIELSHPLVQTGLAGALAALLAWQRLRSRERAGFSLQEPRV